MCQKKAAVISGLVPDMKIWKVHPHPHASTSYSYHFFQFCLGFGWGFLFVIIEAGLKLKKISFPLISFLLHRNLPTDSRRHQDLILTHTVSWSTVSLRNCTYYQQHSTVAVGIGKRQTQWLQQKALYCTNKYLLFILPLQRLSLCSPDIAP